MMTPAQLKAYEFKSAGRNAYKSDDVDVFFGEVLVNYEKMFRENSELIKRVSLLAEKLEQYKNDEVDIKQAVMSAQKAANMIIKEAEDSVADSKAEAEAILAAAKGEAEIIKSDAEKQAIADAELALSLARDKAEEILAKAKEKAHGILIEANESASNTVGAANRTITSESLHYDMLKKEVSEFRASILAQYKAHIELISKLPELAVEEAAKIESVESNESVNEPIEEAFDEDKADCVLEFVDEDAEELSDDVIEESEPVVKTELPYDFFEENSNLQFVEEDVQEEEFPTIENFQSVCQCESDDNALSFEQENSLSEEENALTEEPSVEETEVESNAQADDIPISRFFDDEDDSADEAVEADVSQESQEQASADYNIESFEEKSSFFDMIEKIDDVKTEDEAPAKRRGLFRKKK